ncbi:MAG TPA: undecaprenyl-diphosphate phosphatase [Alphaproteobacteria bacterium]|nr:undecaprenyl-diphosphate phosphatase [Alphaproteobacteria bacterium]
MLLNYLQVIVVAILQGITELFPVSSLGHAVVLPAILLWPIDPKGPGLLPFLVILHLGTAFALVVFYWREWVKLLFALLGGGDDSERPALRRLIVMLIVGTIPAAIVGALFNHALRENFAVPTIAAAFLVINGVILFFGDRRRRLKAASLSGEAGKPLEDLTVTDALIIGVVQCFALIPGISRSGVTIVAGLRRKLTADAAAHFSFLLATPIILGAGLLEVPKLLHAIDNGHADADYLTKSVIGGVIAGIFAYLSVAFLTRYFRVHEVKVMRPFALYCVVAGVASIALFLSRA